MPYSFNPFTGNFDNTPSTLNGDSAYSSVLSNSATWTDGYNTGTVYKANSATYATINFANNKFFPLSGGQITGNTRINGNVTIFGDLTSTGTQTFANTIFSTTSALSVVHVGSGPAVWVGNNGSGDIASFYDIDQGVEVLHIGGANGDFPNVGVKTSAPNKDFTVKGEISATGDIWTTGRILSGNQELASIFRPDIDKGLSVFNTVLANSATAWNYQGTDLKNLSANWQSTYTNVNANSASWSNPIDTEVRNLTGSYSSVYSTVLANSAVNWNYQGTDIKSLTSSWVGGNAAFTNLVSNSAAYLSSVDLSFLSVSANWNSTYNTVLANSATNWNYQGTDLKDLSANWQNTYTNFSTQSAKNDSVYSTVNANSATNWNYQGTDLKNLSAQWVGGNLAYTNLVSNSAAYLSAVDLSFLSVSANWDSVYNTVLANSATNWNYQGTDLKGLSANWQNTYTSYSSNSSSYVTLSSARTNFYPLTGGTLNGSITASSGSFTNIVVAEQDAGDTVLYASNYRVGINTEVPNEALTVKGNISASGQLFVPEFVDLKTVVQSNSAAAWNYQGTDIKALTSSWVGGNAAFTNLVSNSAAYLSSVDLSFLSVSANWNSVYSSVASTSANWNGSYTTVYAKSANWDAAFGTAGADAAVRALTGNWQNTYNTVSTNSAKWESVYSNVNANSATYATIAFADSKFFLVSGGTITGPTQFNSNLTVYGNISATGSSYFSNTFYSTTSALSVVNIGNSGPALYVGNNGTGDIASFYDIDQNVEVLHVGGSNGTFPNVGIKTSEPNKDLTVSGEISSTGDIWTTGRILSGGQELLSLIQPAISNVYNTVNANSATAWNYQGTDLKDLSANWQSTLTTVSSNSAKWESVYSNVAANSASYATSNFVQGNFLPLSGGIVQGKFQAGTGTTAVLTVSGSKVGINTELPNQALTVIGNVSATGIYYGDGSGLTNVGSSGASSWVIANSANAVFNSVSAISLSGTFYGDGSNLIGASLPGQAGVNTLVQTSSASWQNTYNTFSSASANYILDGGNTKGSNLSIGTNDTFNLALETNNVPRLTIFNNGNVGINEAAPEGKLHVTAGSAGSVTAQTSSVGVFESDGNAYLSLLSPTSHYSGVVMGGPTNPYGSYVSWNHDNLALKVSTNHAGASIQMLAGTEQEALRITSSGNVGIGTTSPSEKLTVSGNISASGNLYGNASSLTNVIDGKVRDLSGNWQTGYEYATAYSNASGSLVTYEVGDVIKPRGAIVGSSSDSNVIDVSQTVLDIKSLIYGVQITTSPDQLNFYTWNFNPDGSLTYPDNTSQTTAFTGIPSYVESTYTTVQSNSASWGYQGTDLKDLSASWQGTYTNYSANSASYATVNFVDSKFLPLSGGSIQGNISTTGGMSVGDEFATASLYVSGSKVGINTEAPNKELTVVGSISATNTIYTNYLELSDVKFTNEHLSNVSSITASNDFLKVIVGNNTKYLRLYDVE